MAVSGNIDAVVDFGIESDNVFEMWDRVGGRFSLWSAVGLSISLAVGYDRFEELLDGAAEVDRHFQTTNFEENVPVVLALLGIWYNNFWHSETEAVLLYSHYLKSLPAYLQQVSMESNGKSVDRRGNSISYQTGSVLW